MSNTNNVLGLEVTVKLTAEHVDMIEELMQTHKLDFAAMVQKAAAFGIENSHYRMERNRRNYQAKKNEGAALDFLKTDEAKGLTAAELRAVLQDRFNVQL